MENFNIFYWLLAVIAIGITINNFMKVKTFKREREFVNVYSKVLNESEDAYDAVIKYVNEEKEAYLKNKARVIEVYEKLQRNEDVEELLNEIDFEPLFKEKGRFDAKHANRNGDIFVWLALVFAKANKLDKKEVISKLSEKLTPYDELLSNSLEYRLCKAYTAALLNKEGEDYDFLKKLLDGDYAGMVYEQRLIGLYKRIASSYLVFKGEKIDEYFDNDLRDFGTHLVGKALLTDLNLMDKYPAPVIEETSNEEENNEKDEDANKGIKEDIKEEKKTVKKATTKKAPTKKVTKKTKE